MPFNENYIKHKKKQSQSFFMQIYDKIKNLLNNLPKYKDNFNAKFFALANLNRLHAS